MSFVVSSSPHLKSKTNIQDIYIWVIIALFPTSIAGVYFFGLHALWIILTSVLSAVVFDLICQKLTANNLGLNGSAIITGLLLALVLPPTVPLWLPIIGTAFAIVIAKYPFGPGNNIFNPALIGRTFLAISFPILMSSYVLALTYSPILAAGLASHPDGIASATPLSIKSVDGIASATPLSVTKFQGYSRLTAQFDSKSALYWGMFTGKKSGSIGEVSIICILIGGLFLIFMKIIDWRIPLLYISTVAILAFILNQDVLFYLLAGGLMLGAFFMATDYVTSPLTRNGRVIFAVACGILTVILRLYSNYPEGVAFSILLMNAATPLIDRIVKPKPFGY